MRRCLFILFTGFSLLLFLFASVIWIRSYWVDELMGWAERDDDYFPRYFMAECGRGVITIERMWSSAPPAAPYAWVHVKQQAMFPNELTARNLDRLRLSLGGFQLGFGGRTSSFDNIGYFGVGVPVWIFMLPALIPPLVIWRGKRAHKKRGFAVKV